MAFALLANLPAVNGLYSSFFPLLTYFFLGGIHQMVPGKGSPLTLPLLPHPHPSPTKHDDLDFKDTGHGEGGSVSTFICSPGVDVDPT